MRKKSHISLAKYLVEDMETLELEHHRKSFYLGSILPDCKPSFLTKKHEFGGTFGEVTEALKALTVECNLSERNERVYWRRLGEVIHYMADYFTFPHNVTYDGNLKDHCIYEKELKNRLKEYIRSGEAEENQQEVKRFYTVEALIHFIEASHAEYLMLKRSVEEDIRYIVELCRQVVAAVVELLYRRMGTVRLAEEPVFA